MQHRGHYRISTNNGIDTFTSISEASLHRSVSLEMRRTVQNVTYAYDLTANLISKTDATALTINYTYDSLNRLKGIVFPDITQNVSYMYDSTGKVLSMTDPSGTTAYSYDNSNRLLTDTKTIEGKTFNTSYSYTLSGALTAITYPSGRIVSYEYDPIGRIVRVIEEKDGKRSEIIKSIAYLPSGAISSITQGNGIVTSKTYDIKNQLSSLNIGNLKQLSYVRDNIGNITAITDILDSTKNKMYTYDALYRLTQAVGQWGTIQYNYDPVGNRLTETSSSGNTTYSYSANKLTSGSGVKNYSFGYDNNGNTISENQKQYVYNQNQRLIRAVENGKTLGEYLYNGNGQRVKKTANDRTTYFIYDQSGNLIEEADEQGQVNIDYIYLGSVPIARADEWWEGLKLPDAPIGGTLIPGDKQLSVSWNESPAPVDGYKVYWGTQSRNYTDLIDVGKITSYTITGLDNGISYYIAVKAYADIKAMYFYHTDHLGTPIMMTDKQGNKVWDGEFMPFGEEYSVTGSVTNNLRFPGQYDEKEIGLYQNINRTYNFKTDRYNEKDPAGISAGVNLYLYANANPVSYIDRTGTYVEVGTRSFYKIPISIPILPIPNLTAPLTMGISLTHCFVRFNGNNADTLSFDNMGVHEDPAASKNSSLINFLYNIKYSKTEPKCNDKDNCVRQEMMKCGSYKFLNFNCCDCVKQALSNCGLQKKGLWPNLGI